MVTHYDVLARLGKKEQARLAEIESEIEVIQERQDTLLAERLNIHIRCQQASECNRRCFQ